MEENQNYTDGNNQPLMPPPNYLVWAILSTILCCLPLGIVSIVYAAQVNTKFIGQDYQGALDSSRKARQFAIISAIAGGIVLIIYIIFMVVGGAAALLQRGH